MDDCIFCKIANGEIPANFIYSDENGIREICSRPFIDEKGHKHHIGDVIREYCMDNERLSKDEHLANILSEKVRSSEVDGREFGNVYKPSEVDFIGWLEYKLYFIDKERPHNIIAANVGPLIRKKYLVGEIL